MLLAERERQVIKLQQATDLAAAQRSYEQAGVHFDKLLSQMINLPWRLYGPVP